MEKYIKYFVILIFVFSNVNTIFSQIPLPANIEKDTLVLTKTDSYYVAGTTVTVQSTGTLKIEKGVEIRFANGVGMNIQGKLIVNGTTEEMVTFTSTDTTARWSYITANNAFIQLNGVHVSRAQKFISANYGQIIINECKVTDTYDGIGYDCIAIHYASVLKITNCELHGNPEMARIDAIDCDDVNDAEICYNKIMDFEDDGVDFGTNSTNISVHHNYIYNCNMGVSIGENSTANVFQNTIVNCDAGLQSHTGSIVNSYNNTLYGNVKGMECHHGSSAGSAGKLIVNSSIISECSSTLYTIQTDSTLIAKYSISDTDTLPGETNKFGNPLFMNTDSLNFKLQETSPCIDAGDPSSGLPFYGESIDMGAFEFGMKDTVPPDTSSNVVPILPNMSENGTIFYPNPAQSQIILHNLPDQNYVISIFNMNGTLVNKIVHQGLYYPINVSCLEKGIYFISAEGLEKNDQYKSKLIIQ